MKLLDKYGVPQREHGSVKPPIPQYRFIFHMEGFEAATFQVDSVEINFITTLEVFFRDIGMLEINVVMRDTIENDTFNDLLKYARTINGNKLRIEQTDNTGDVVKTIRATIVSISSISTKFDYTSSDPVKIHFSLSCNYDDTVE